MRHFSKISVAVVTALVAGSAFALPPSTTSYDVNLVVSGSSAFRDSFQSEMANVCSDTLDTYKSSANDFRAYTCTLSSTAGTGLSGKKAIVYYRSEGGSVYGVAPIAMNKQVKRLVVDSSCTGSSPSYTCAISGYDIANDSGSGHLVNATTLLGVSDVEPAQFVGENWPDTSAFGATPPASLSAITSVTAAIGQTFAVYVNSGVSASALNLSRQSIASIFSGLYADWSQVPKADGSGFVSSSSLPIYNCLREKGSGTQASASIYFLGVNCSTAATPFYDPGYARNTTTTDELSCVSTNPGGIGYANVQNSVPSGTSIVNLDGITPSRVNAATGTYGYWVESTFNSGAALAATTYEKTLANTLIARVSKAATTPASPNNTVFALPGGSAGNVPVLPVDSNHPVGLGSKSGSNCRAPLNQN